MTAVDRAASLMKYSVVRIEEKSHSVYYNSNSYHDAANKATAFATNHPDSYFYVVENLGVAYSPSRQVEIYAERKDK